MPVTIGSDQADEDADRGDDVGEEMLAVGDQRRRAARRPSRIRNQHQAPLIARGDAADDEARDRRVEHARGEERAIGLAEDRRSRRR